MKGISPLVAAVLLIAATMSIAGILAYWASSFVRSSLPEINKTDVECSGSNFNVYAASYNSTTKNFTMMLENTGVYNVKISKIDFVYADMSVESHDVNGVLSVSGALNTFVVASVTQNYQKYRVISTCPQLVVEK